MEANIQPLTFICDYLIFAFPPTLSEFQISKRNIQDSSELTQCFYYCISLSLVSASRLAGLSFFLHGTVYPSG